MSNLAYVLITPYSLLKSRTGGILSRILSNNDLELRAVRVYAPSDRMVDAYIEAINKDRISDHDRNLFTRYVEENLRKDNPSNISNRCVFLLFEGDDAVNIIKQAVGFVTYTPKGDSVRITYGDYITHGESIVYFEPAVLYAPDEESVKNHLKVFKAFGCSDGGVVTEQLKHTVEEKDGETTLVMVKPDNFRRRSTRPGNIIDMFAKTGLYIVGAKMVRFSVAQAEEFYKPLKKIFEEKLEKQVRKRLESIMEENLPFPVYSEDLDYITRRLRKNNAVYEFNRIVEYISGQNPDLTSEEDCQNPGRERCLCLLYYGRDSVAKVRKMLGDTNPQEAEGGTVRSDFGQDILKNGVHASDSVKSANRERKIVGLVGNEDCELDEIVPY
jgi:nucleoside diphosphate kinase